MHNPKNKIQELTQKINKHDHDYYYLDNPIITDQEYDSLIDELKTLEKKYPEHKKVDSPTQRVGAEPLPYFEKVKHRYPMLSLDNVFSFEGFEDFEKKTLKLLNTNQKLQYVCEPKIDGLSISLSYQNGQLKEASTRGNGQVGENVTMNIKTIRSIPLSIPYKKDLEVRGEVYFPLIEFHRINKLREEKGLPSFANPRNAAAGTIRQLDSKIVAQRNLSAFIYRVINEQSHQITSQHHALEFLKDNGFLITKIHKFATSLTEVTEYVNWLDKKRNELNYEIDGVVIKIDDLSLHNVLGKTSKFTRAAIAYKFSAEEAETTLEAINLDVGRTGKITYNAVLSPVKLAGTTVRAATLHNADYIKLMNINKGDRVIVYKAGEIIPKVKKLSENNPNKDYSVKWKAPTNCPSCFSKLKTIEGEVDQYCINNECSGIKIKQIIHFCSKSAMDLRGLAINILERFFKIGIIKNVADIYKLKEQKNEILQLEGFKEKSVNNILYTIEKSKNQDLYRFIFGVGIRHVGERTAKLLANNFGNIFSDANISEQDLLKVKDIGEQTAKAVCSFRNNPNLMSEVNELFSLGVKPSIPQKIIPSNGKKVVITGTLSKPRDHFVKLMEANGYESSSALSSNTDFLLIGENPGSKKNKAEKMKIKILTEQNFYKLINDEEN